MARRFAKVSQEELVAINETAFFLSICRGGSMILRKRGPVTEIGILAQF